MDGVADLFSRHSQRLALVASIALVALMGLLIANTAIFYIEDTRSTAVSAPREPAAGVPRAPAVRSSFDIAALSLFGKVQQAAPTETVVDAPETKLNLELQGVFIADNADASTAIVAEGAKDGKLYEVGKSLPGNAVLKGVFHDHILLQRGARVEKLKFSDAAFRTPTPASGAPTASAPRVPRVTPARDMRRNTPSNSAERLRSVNERREARRREMAAARAGSTSIRNYIDGQRERISTDPTTLLTELGVSAVSGGATQGYRVGANVSHPALRNTGLRQDDVILSVNGTPVGDVTRDSAIIEQVLAVKKARVQIQRGKSKFFITVPVP